MNCFKSRVTRIALGLAFVLLAASPASATIRYTVSVAQQEEHLVRVAMTVPHVHDSLVVQLPAWNALYQIRDFAQHVQDVRASDVVKKSLPVVKLDKQTWRVSGSGTVTLEYAVYADESGPFSAQLNSHHAFLNLALILFYVPDRRSEDVRIEYAGLREGWGIAVALPGGESSTVFRAPNYDALVDAPVEIGGFREFRLEAATARIRVAVHGDGWDHEKLSNMLRRVVGYQVELMRQVPFDEFLFLYHFGQLGRGGMEHANSTAMHLEAGASPDGVSAHEFFHLWNVKRIRPQSLEPVDYTRENWTRALWFAEGVTSTYAAYTLVRTGLWSRQQFYDDLARQISTLESRPARRWKSVEEASLDAWLEKYSSYGRPTASISYYNKGQLLGVLLDILIRDATNNRASFDDALRYLNEEVARAGRFYEDSAGIRAAVLAVLSRVQTGTEKIVGRSISPDNKAPLRHPGTSAPEGSPDFSKDVDEFFARYVAGTEDLPYSQFLARAGLNLKSIERTRVELGFVPARGPESTLVVTQLQPGSAAEQAGIREGDFLLELDGKPFPRNPDPALRDRRPGDSVRIRLRRGGEEKEPSFALAERQEPAFEIAEEKNPGDKERRIRDGLLIGKTD